MICKACGKETTDESVETCEANANVKYTDGTVLDGIPHDGFPSERCHVCKVKPGGFHHVFCELEMCPRCGTLLVVCATTAEIREKARRLAEREVSRRRN